jgi:DNA repair exonuclease SbcCD nuclease subunit
MSETRFITSSDEHLADLNPGFRKDNYRDAILKKLEWQGELAKKFGAMAMLRGGDFFHVKAANKTTYATSTAAAEVHRRYHCPTFAMPGNHDMSNNDPASVPRQPIGLLLKSGLFHLLRDESFTDGTIKTRVVGVEYTTDLAVDGLADLVRKKPGDTYTIAFVHALASMAPEERVQSFFNENIFDYRDLVFEGCPDVYVFGHYHKDQGIQEHMGVKFVNLGAVSRGALTFENLERKPKVALIKANSQGIFVEEQIVPHADAADVFDLELKKRLDTERRSLNDFITKLRENRDLSSDLTSDSLMDQRKRELDTMPQDVRALALELLEAAEAGVADE